MEDQGFVISFIQPEYTVPLHHHWRVERMYAEEKKSRKWKEVETIVDEN